MLNAHFFVLYFIILKIVINTEYKFTCIINLTVSMLQHEKMSIVFIIGYFVGTPTHVVCDLYINSFDSISVDTMVSITFTSEAVEKYHRRKTFAKALPSITDYTSSILFAFAICFLSGFLCKYIHERNLGG